MSTIAKIAIIGAGAMGAFYAGRLCDMDPRSVCLVAGGERARRLGDEGLLVNGHRYMPPVVDPQNETMPADLVIVGVKHQHLHDAIADMRHCVGDETIILSVMNGVDSEEQIGAVYGMDKVLYAVAVGIDAVRVGNAVTYSTQGTLFFGEADNTILSDRVRRVQALFDRAGIVYETPADMIRVLWWKFMINVGINQTSAILRAPYGVFQESADARELMNSAMQEVVAVAETAGIHISAQDIEDWYGFLSQLSPAGKTSMLQDVEAGRKTEVEMFAGKMVQLGAQFGVPTPVNQTLYRIIRVIERS